MTIRNLFKNNHSVVDSLESGLIEDLKERKDLWVSWILDSKINEVVTYYTGFLSADRDPVRPNSVWPNIIGRLMWNVAVIPKTPAGDSHLSWGSGMKIVELYQKRHENGLYFYRARKILEVPMELKPAWRLTLNSM